jgi:hypothetical protein
MFSKKLSIVFILILTTGISGCASTKIKESCEQFDKDNTFFNATVFDRNEYTSTVKLETNEKTEFYDSKPSKIFSGIASVNLNGAELNVQLFNQGLFEQYSAPVVDVMLEQRSKSNPLGYTPLPAPLLAWIFTPEKMQNLTHGCTSRRFLNTERDESKKVKTGKSEWQNTYSGHKILISSFDKDYEFNVDADTSTKVIDLSSAILNTPSSKNTTLKITCLDCNLLGAEEKNLYPNVKTEVVLTHDFSATKLALNEAQKNRDADAEKAKIEQAKQAQIPKANAVSSCANDFNCPTGYACRTKPVSGSECRLKSPVYDPAITATTPSPVITQTPVAVEHEDPIISNLEEIKTQCAKLFKPKTDKFGKCVLELTK